MKKIFKVCLLAIVQLILFLLPLIAVYSFFKGCRQKVSLKDNLRHIGQHYFLGFLFSKPKVNNCIMIHAISLGEADAAINLISFFQPQIRQKIILTVTTIQAYKKLTNQPNDITIVYFPFDSLVHQSLFIHHFNIRKAIIIEHDFWPNFLATMDLLNREIILLNGHFSDKTINRLNNRYYQALLFSPIKKVFVQTTELKTKMLPVMPNVSISVTPSYKLPLNTTVLDIKNINSERKIITLSNFHPEELNTVSELLAKLVKLDYKIILVPRHIHLFDNLIKKWEEVYQNRFAVITQWNNATNITAEITFVKSYGVLSKIYSLSHATIVFGSFDPSLKGHSLFEPILYGSMVYYGPYFSSQQYMDEFLRRIITNIKHDTDSIEQQIKHLSTHDRIDIYNKFMVNIENEKHILINHFKEIEQWIKNN